MKKQFMAAFLAASLIVGQGMSAMAAQAPIKGDVGLNSVRERVADGNTMELAQEVKFDVEVSHTRAPKDKDYYKFTLPSSGIVTLKGMSDIEELHYSVRNENGEVVWGDKSALWNVSSKTAAYDWNFRLTKGTYYILLKNRYQDSIDHTNKDYGRDKGTYRFTLYFRSAGESFTETGYGTNNSIMTADSIQVNKGYKGQIAENDTADYFRFKLDEKDTVKLAYSFISDTTIAPSMFLYDDRGQAIKQGNTNYGDINYNGDFKLEPGTYYVAVSKQVDESWVQTGTYSFTVTSSNPGNWGEIPLASVKAGDLVATGKTLHTNELVKDKNGKYVDISRYALTTTPGKVVKVGTYELTVKGKGNYTGTLKTKFNVNPAGTSITKLTPAKNSITVNLKKQSVDTKGYEIQYSTLQNFRGAKTEKITKNSTVKHTINKLESKKTYYVRVRTYQTVKGKNYVSAWSAAKSVKVK